MNDWKTAERRIAEELGGRRVPVSGCQRGDVPDTEHLTLLIEVKSRKRLLEWIKEAMEQAEASAVQTQFPVAVLHQDGDRYANALVVMRLDDLKRRLECACYDGDDELRGKNP